MSLNFPFLNFLLPGIEPVAHRQQPSMNAALPVEQERGALAAEVHRLENSVSHLLRSNEELRHALLESPDDADFKTALQENDGVILKYRAKIEELELAMSALPAHGARST